MRWCLVVCALAACSRVTTTPGSDDAHTITLSIDRRPTVRDATVLEIAVDSAGTTAIDTATVTVFPMLFHVEPNDLIGRVDIRIDARNRDGELVGRGVTTTTANADDADVMLQGADFLLNSSYTGDQFLTDDFDAAGVQLAATGTGTWTVAFRDECAICGIYGRRFDAFGDPLASGAGSSTAQFTLSTTPTTSAANPAVAAGATTTLVLWDFTDPSTSAQGIACRPLDAQGNAMTPAQQTLASELTDVVTAIALASGNFVVTWQGFMQTASVRAMVVGPGCSVVSQPTTVSVATGTKGPYRAHVAASGTELLYTWIVDGNLHVRAGTDGGTLPSSERVLVYHGEADEIEQARITPWGNDFAIAARWSATFSGGVGRLELYRVSAQGQVLAAAIPITDIPRSDTASDRAFGVAQRSDGLLLIVWEACPTGPGSCDVLGQFVGVNNELAGEAFVVPTATSGDQSDPSVTVIDDAFVIAWTDASASLPDTSGDAVRARIIIPAL